MNIPSHFLPINNVRVKAPKKATVNLEKQQTNADATKQEVIAPVQEKRKGKDRRKRNIKPLLDTRTGRDRRYDKDKPSIDIKA